MKSKKKGSSLYFALVIMTVVSGIAIGLSAVLINQIRIARGMGNSVVALYAADSGIEDALEIMRRLGEDGEAKLLTVGEQEISVGELTATYKILATSSDEPACSAKNFCIKSIGEFLNVRRAIEIDF